MKPPEQRRADRYAARFPRHRLVALLVTGLLLGAGGGFVLGMRGRPTAPAPRGVGEAAGGTHAHATPECTSAVARANQGLSYAVRLDRAFVAQTQVVEQLARQQISVEHAVESGRAAAAKGGDAAEKFDEALASYLRVVDSCQLEGQ